MNSVCRLCCSRLDVTHHIFDETSFTYIKLSTCLPVKVSKDDKLPQKICKRCQLRLDDCYQFCSEAMASQKRLRESITTYAPQIIIEDLKPEINEDDFPTLIPDVKLVPPQPIPTKQVDSKFTQTSELDVTAEDKQVEIKEENTTPLQIKTEEEKAESVHDDNLDDDYVPSDYSDDISLKMLKKRKKKTKKDKKDINDEVKKRKRKRKNDKYEEFTDENDKIIKINNILEPDVSLAKANGITIKKEWMNVADFLETSLIRTEGSEEALLYCCICFVQCAGRNEMIAHYRSHVNMDEVTTEPECNRVAAEDGDSATYKCKMCDKIFDEREAAEKHARTHVDKRPYRCSLCEKTFREASQILKHGRTHSYAAPQSTPVAECVVRGCETSRQGALCPDSHLLVRPASHPQPLSKRFICDLCDEGFVYMRYLLEHRNTAHPEASSRKLVNRCMHCAREFAHLNSLRRHLRSHTGERNFLCNVCGKALSSREHLKFHIRIHTGYKPNVCKTCGKGFVKKCNLTLHERVHSGEKPHVCSHCGKAFSQRSTLVIHERYHSGARPYVCTLCGRGFVAKGLLSMHLKTTCI